MHIPPLILASASPRRRDLLAQAGIACEIWPADIDETPRADEQPVDYVRRLARAKAEVVAAAATNRPVLGADTAVVLDGIIFGKPADAADASRMLRSLSGREHEVLSAIALFHRGGCSERVATAQVRMRELSDDEIAAYCSTGEPYDKAGGYAIQSAAAFVELVDGDLTTVVGLPIDETLAMLRTAGVIKS